MGFFRTNVDLSIYRSIINGVYFSTFMENSTNILIYYTCIINQQACPNHTISNYSAGSTENHQKKWLDNQDGRACIPAVSSCLDYVVKNVY